MLKVLAGLGIGIVIGMCALPAAMLVGMRHIEDTANTAFADTVMQAIEPELDRMLMPDDLENYRACMHAAYSGDANEAFDACKYEYAVWEESPTFAAEFNKLLQMDSEIAEIIAEFDAANGTSF